MMPSTLERVTVRLVCRRCRRDWELCVPVRVAVPGPLRCVPSGGPAPGAGSSSGLHCPHCGCSCGMDESRMRELVEGELRRGRGRHVRAGAVIIECR